MANVLIDASVLIQWFHGDGESELESARALRSAHVAGEIDARMLDLALYEVGNVLTRSLHWPAEDIADQLDDLQAILGPPLAMSSAWLRSAAELADPHTLSFYDASWSAAAVELGIPLVSADSRLISANLADSPGSIVARLGLPLA